MNALIQLRLMIFQFFLWCRFLKCQPSSLVSCCHAVFFFVIISNYVYKIYKAYRRYSLSAGLMHYIVFFLLKEYKVTTYVISIATRLFPAGLFPANFSPLGLFPAGISSVIFKQGYKLMVISFVLVWLILIRIYKNWFGQLRLGQNRFGLVWFNLLGQNLHLLLQPFTKKNMHRTTTYKIKPDQAEIGDAPVF